MGYLIGGQRPTLIKGTEEEFRNAIAARTSQIVPDVKPQRSVGANFKKTASVSDVTRSAPLFNDPRYTSSTLAIPTDDRTLHGLYRFFAETDPIVGAALKINSELPLANLSLGQCEDTGVQQHFEDMWDRINGRKILQDATSEFFEIGDVTMFGAFDESSYMWDQFAILNPDYVKIESVWINSKPLIKLIPDEALKRIVQTQSPRFIYDQLPPEIIRYVLFNQEIPLDPNNTFHIAHAKRPYEARGRSIIKRILKILMLEDRFNQALFALATRHAVPLTVVKLGDPTSGFIPNETEIDSVREMFSNWEMDPNFSIFYHYGINVEFYGSNGKMLPVGPELDRIYKLKFIGLGVHEQLLTGGGGSYSQAYINLEVQRQRYLNLQLKLEQLVHIGWFKSVADLCGFYRVKNAMSGYGGAKNYKWGNVPSTTSLQKIYASLRDFKDNVEFREFLSKKAAEQEQVRQIREYVYPKLDWGGMNASTDENLKNYLKWLVDKRPHLVDDATLARLGKLDRDDQEKAFVEDARRARDRYSLVAKEGLLPFINKGKGGGGGDLGGGGMPGDIPVDMGGGLGAEEPGMVGGAPDMPTGEGGAPEAAGGGMPPPAGVNATMYKELKNEVIGSTDQDDLIVMAESDILKKNKRIEEDYAILKEVERKFN